MHDGRVKLFYTNVIDVGLDTFMQISMGIKRDEIYLSPFHLKSLEK